MNIPGDIAMLIIAIPLLVSLQLPRRQKAILIFIFGLYGLVIVFAILTKLYCLVPSLVSYNYINWYFREASIAVYATNIPAAWPLKLWMFPGLERSKSKSQSRPQTGQTTLAHKGSKISRSSSSAMYSKRSRSITPGHYAPHRHASLGCFSPTMEFDDDLESYDGFESEDHITKPEPVWNPAHDEQIALEIYRQITVSVESETKDFDIEKAIRAQILQGV